MTTAVCWSNFCQKIHPPSLSKVFLRLLEAFVVIFEVVLVYIFSYFNSEIITITYVEQMCPLVANGALGITQITLFLSTELITY